MRRWWLYFSLFVISICSVPAPATAANTFPTNPVGFAYQSTANVSLYAQQG